MSLGAGHVWRTVAHPLGGIDVWEIECVRCGKCRGAREARVTCGHYDRPKRGKTYERTSFRFFHGRPIGTCKGTR